MTAFIRLTKCLLAAVLLLLSLAVPLTAQTNRLDDLFSRLKRADAAEASRIEREIYSEWSKSGSPAMDLLLQRGQEAMAAGDLDAAIEHFTALTDHAPDFAAGWNARATAYYLAGEFGPSVNDIARTLTLEPRHFAALAGLGMIFRELDQPEKALEVYRAALAIHPHLAGVRDTIEALEAETGGQDL